jgi:hypothetical protein
MYLVELCPGREELYKSADELTAAIRRGEVDSHSRIFHRATAKWVPITVHPQFKANAPAASARAARAAAPRSEPLPPPPRRAWTFLPEPRGRGAAPPPEESDARAVAAGVTTADAGAVEAGESDQDQGHAPIFRARRTAHGSAWLRFLTLSVAVFAFGVGCLLLINR